jgi:hypothetical protein
MTTRGRAGCRSDYPCHGVVLTPARCGLEIIYRDTQQPASECHRSAQAGIGNENKHTQRLAGRLAEGELIYASNG